MLTTETEHLQQMATHPAPGFHPDLVIRFLRAVRPHHHLISISALGGGLRRLPLDLDEPDLDVELREMRSRNADGQSIYFHANPVRQGFSGVKAANTDVLCGEFLQVDVDPRGAGTYDERKARVMELAEALMRGECPPTFTNGSGNGVNLLWRLRDPIHDVDEYERVNRAINVALGASGTLNIDRILKVPGTIAWSNQTKLGQGLPRKRPRRNCSAKTRGPGRPRRSCWPPSRQRPAWDSTISATHRRSPGAPRQPGAPRRAALFRPRSLPTRRKRFLAGWPRCRVRPRHLATTGPTAPARCFGWRMSAGRRS